ncbi:MAG TPA: hypothetical protein VF157_10415 [Chloroflexota bacterium]
MSSLSLTPEQAARFAAAVRSDPVVFQHDVLGHDGWDIPNAFLRDLAKPRSRTAVRSCHASSKSFTAADAALWFTGALGGITIISAPKALQVKQVLFGEIHRSYDVAATNVKV